MPSQRFDQARPFVTLGLIVAAWVILPAIIKGFVRASFFELQAPVAISASYLRDVQEYWGLRAHSNEELIAAGRDLARGMASSFEVVSQQNTELERALTFLATTASAAPFIGLFGTVWGIMHAFLGLSATQSSTIQAVAPGIAEALIATATGLFAAIPAVVAYNSFARQIRVLSTEMDNFAFEFLNIAERHFLK